LPPATPFTWKVTAVFVLLVTVAVNCCVALRFTDAAAGESVIVTVVDDELFFPPQPASKTNATTTTATVTRFIRISSQRSPPSWQTAPSVAYPRMKIAETRIIFARCDFVQRAELRK
jgi:type IV secretory pathway VirB9-like protein